MWLGPALKVPYRGVSHWDWRWILDYSGGQLTDWAGHHIDIANWGAGLEHTGPVEISGSGVYPLKVFIMFLLNMISSANMQTGSK